MDLYVQHDWKEDEYYIKQKHNGQTYYLAFQMGENEDGTIVYANVYASVFSKRKHRSANEDNQLSTGKDMFYSYAFFKRAFKLLEEEVIKMFYYESVYHYQKLIIEVGWTDAKRRDTYYKVLSPMGYTYQYDDCHKKIITKQFTRDEAKEIIEG